MAFKNRTVGSEMLKMEENTVTIKPSKGWIALKLKDLWEYRELLYFFVWRDIKIRYRQTFFGAAWAVFQPFFGMVVFSIIFGRLAKMPSDGIPYPVFSFAALVPWTFFVNALTQSSNSLIGNVNLVTKIYVPRLIIPLGSILAGLLDFLIAFLILLGIMFYYGLVPTLHILLVPFILLLVFAAALGTGLWFAALNVEFRDVKYVIPFLSQLWMYGSPIVYPASLIPESWRLVYSLNPMAGAIEGFRWVLIGNTAFPGQMLLVSSLTALFLLISGAFYFKRMEQSFADVV